MGKRTRHRRSRLVLPGRIRGGLRGFLSAILHLDPDRPEPKPVTFRRSQLPADQRARELREARRARRRAKRSPF